MMQLMSIVQSKPLAYRLRPTELDDFVGQDDIVGEGTALRTSIQRDTLRSVILAGPPGSGKTTLASIIAKATNAEFVSLNAVTSGVKDLKAVCEEAERMMNGMKQRTILFIDEIHRFNKAQQDALLPYVENGSVILIGATTQNPYFEVNQALVSRSQVYLLKPLSEDQLLDVLKRALTHPDGFAGTLTVEEKALRHMAAAANGDARIALNLLELTAITVGNKISIKDAEKLLRDRNMRYDKSGEDHYNTISAFIKSMRGSDVDAALLWMYKMLQSGEEPRFIFRRMAIFASEDVGNADPRALGFVMDAWRAFEFVGLPEGEFFLAHACVYVTQAPKSNAVTIAMGKTKKAIRDAPSLEVPNHLRNAPLKGMKEQGYHEGYQYPHHAQGAVVSAHYFPEGMQPQDFYEPTERGFESEMRERMNRVKAAIRADGMRGKK
ncbi:replication-associated recombination protein A [Candidatus Peregrinibacteria bacterium]|nr:replication-associated recombination protein A [Candidatus Peregrinibacteria bacterium]